MTELDSTMIDLNGQEVSLATIAQIDMGQVEEVRFEAMPAGMYQWRGTNAEITVRGSGENATPGVLFEAEVIACDALADPTKNPQEMIGKNHGEFFGLKDPVAGLGRVKAFLTDIGLPASGSLESVMQHFPGYMFRGVITNRPDKNDKSRIFANFSNKKGELAPLAPQQQTIAQTEQAAQTAQPAQPAPQVPQGNQPIQVG